MMASRHRCATHCWCHASLIIRKKSQSTVGSWLSPSLGSSIGSSSGSIVFAFATDLKAAVTSFSIGLTLKARVTDKPLGEPFDDVESEIVRFRVENGAEELLRWSWRINFNLSLEHGDSFKIRHIISVMLSSRLR